MRLGATWTNLFTLMLLSLSSVASACDIRCDMAVADAGCTQTQSVDQPVPAMASMVSHQACCQRTVSLSLPSCHHGASAHQPALLSEPIRIAAHATDNPAAVGPGHVPIASLDATAPTPVRGPPRFRTVSPISLHTILRV